jgi:hypothetical protein
VAFGREPLRFLKPAKRPDEGRADLFGDFGCGRKVAQGNGAAEAKPGSLERFAPKCLEQFVGPAANT